jgi:hypothetical protein
MDILMAMKKKNCEHQVHGLPECLLYEYVIEQKNKEVRVMH